MTFQLFTTSYKNFKKEMGLPIQTSNGRPKWSLDYVLNHRLPDAMPNWSWIRQGFSQEQFKEAYFRKLARTGADGFNQMFTGVAAASGETDLVLLCFEDITKPDLFCHRTMFAEWWLLQTGEEIKEL